jgi:hypothetical protein
VGQRDCEGVEDCAHYNLNLKTGQKKVFANNSKKNIQHLFNTHGTFIFQPEGFGSTQADTLEKAKKICEEKKDFGLKWRLIKSAELKSVKPAIAESRGWHGIRVDNYYVGHVGWVDSLETKTIRELKETKKEWRLWEDKYTDVYEEKTVNEYVYTDGSAVSSMNTFQRSVDGVQASKWDIPVNCVADYPAKK